MDQQQNHEPGTPYCSHCGYALSGLTESSRCPECGRPLVEVLRRARDPAMQSGKRYRSESTIFGMPLVHVATGPRDGEPKGKARGFIAIGDEALGVIAIGGTARGVVAIGGAAVGVFAMGGMGIGLVSAAGGGAISAGLAVGGGAAGTIAKGGGALGFIADGGGALGYFARGGGAFGRYALGQNPGANAPEAVRLFDQMSWLLGNVPTANAMSGAFFYTFGLTIAATVVAGGLLALFGWMRARTAPVEPVR
jgi:hypothetical protein